MSYTPPPSVVTLLAGIDAGTITPAEADSAIRQAGGKDYVELAVIRQLAAGGGGGIGGSTGSTDNAILRADGTGGATLQSSLATIDDSGRIQTTRQDTAQPTIALGAGLQAGFMTNSDSLVAFVGSNTFIGFASSFHGICVARAMPIGWVNGMGDSVEEKFSRVSAYVIAKNFGEQNPIQIVTAAYTVDATPGDHTIVGNAPSTPFPVMLLDATASTGRVLKFKNKGAAAMTLDATGLGQIFTTSLVNTQVLNTGDACELQSDGTNWLLS